MALYDILNELSYQKNLHACFIFVQIFIKNAQYQINILYCVACEA